MLVQDLPSMSSCCLGEGEDSGADDLFWSFLHLVALLLLREIHAKHP